MVRLPKWVVVVLALALLFAFAAPSFAEATHGKIKSVAADNKEFVFTDKDGKDWTFQLTDDARIRLGTKDLKLADLKTGQEVAIIYDKQDNKLMARVIREGDVAQGKIKTVAADNKEFVFTDKDGKDWTFQLSDDSRIRLADKDLKLNDLKTGDEVAVIYEKQGAKLMAKEVCGTKR
jgi:Cu/Ag efflux protein CusF